MDVVMIWHHRGFLCDKHLLYTPDGHMFDMNMMSTVLPPGEGGEDIDRQLDSTRLLQRLALTYEETVMLGALALMSPGTCNA